MSLEPRTTASDTPSCAQCGRPLRGRQERFCSDRCRMRLRRDDEAIRRRELLGRLQDLVGEVETELLGDGREAG